MTVYTVYVHVQLQVRINGKRSSKCMYSSSKCMCGNRGYYY